MTVPEERFRSICCMPDLLAAAAREETLDETLRQRARALLATYPTERELCRLIEAKELGLPDASATVLQTASEWLEDLRLARRVPQAVADLRRRIERHFPARWELEHQRQAASEQAGVLWPTIDEWIRPGTQP